MRDLRRVCDAVADHSDGAPETRLDLADELWL